MAPLEVIFPNEMHVLPTQVASAAMKLFGVQPLTSEVAMIVASYRRGTRREIETLDDLSDAAAWHGLNVAVRLTPNVKLKGGPGNGAGA